MTNLAGDSRPETTRDTGDAAALQPETVGLDALLRHLRTGPEGLSGVEAAARLQSHGPNDALDTPRPRHWSRLLARLRNPLVIILLAASLLSASTGDVASFAVIAVILLLSMLLDFAQETQALAAIDALRRSVALSCSVRRDGRTATVPVAQLVPGDVIEVIAGDLIPADARLLSSRDLFLNQALLTGEPYPVEKHTEEALPAAGLPPAARADVLAAGTSVVSGTGAAVVFRTGRDTALGGVAAALASKPPATAFESSIRRFGLMIVRLTVLLVLVVLLINIGLHRPALEALMFALALAVGLTPELLPMIVTVTLARAATALARRKVIVKRLAALHDIGAMDVLCTDKTGTLTEARIALTGVVDGLGRDSREARLLAYVNSRFESGMRSPLDDAILQQAPADWREGDWRKLDEVPFDFERRRVSVLVESGGERRIVVKGAPEDLLRRSAAHRLADGTGHPLDPAARAAIEATFQRLSQEGHRLLGVATRPVEPGRDHASGTDEAGLTFAGFAVFLDPPKPSAGATIAALRRDGVAVKVLTGDNEHVARHVFAAVGVPVLGVLTGEALTALTDEALVGQLERVNLFCRVNPQQKLRVLLALRRMGHVVGFLGDGINDAPALHAADVGISVDGAADVARQAADLILLAHDLSVVHEAISQGRATVRNVAKYLLMGSSSNFGNMLSMAGAALVLPFLPMLPIQILLNNLLYDVAQLAIPFDRVDPEDVAKPVRWNIRQVERFMLLFGPLSSLFDALTFLALLLLFRADPSLFQTGWFLESLATQVLVVFVIRTRRPMLRSRPHRLLLVLAFAVVGITVLVPVTPVGAWFGFTPPPPSFYPYLAATVAAYLGLVEAVKRGLIHRREQRPAAKRRPLARQHAPQ